MSTKDQDDYDTFCQLQPAPRWQAFKAERERADKAESRVRELETRLLIKDEFGDPFDSAMNRIKELLSMFKCQSCYDKGWVVGIEGADPGGGDPGNECQVICPDCSLPTPEATQ